MSSDIKGEIPEVTGWFHGIRLDAVVCVEYEGGGVRVHYVWNGVSYSKVIPVVVNGGRDVSAFNRQRETIVRKFMGSK